ncbi:MAG: putative SOS response-associated peptidase YedK [Flavobacteriales bacterium]|jgi:putative SOS response-associated peptidase YedK
MCGRFFNHIHAMHRWSNVLSVWPNNATLSFNIAPSQFVPIITRAGVLSARWGLIPSWSPGFSSRYATHNARVESVESKPAYRDAFQASRFCAVPAGGYYEWREGQASKQAYCVTMPDDMLMFAGVWEQWGSFYSFSILTCPAASKLKTLHPRMPILLSQADSDNWLRGESNNSEELNGLSQSSLYSGLTYYPLTSAVGNVRRDLKTFTTPIQKNLF